MSRNNITIREGSRLDYQVITDDPDAVSVTLFIRNDAGIVYEVGPVPFVNQVADLQDVEEISDLPLGDYDLQINQNYATGSPYKFPDARDCDGEDCTYLILTICDAIDVEGES